MTASEVKKIHHFDGLRGVAAMMVFLAHLTISLLPAAVTMNPAEAHHDIEWMIGVTPISVLWCGNFGVCVFFVLSGYVLSVFCQQTRLGFAGQCVRRYIRLVGPIVATSFIAWALLKLGLYANYKASMVTKSGWLSMWYNFEPRFWGMLREALLDIFRKGQSQYNSNLWTMLIELDASVMIFALFILMRQRALRMFLCVVFAGIHVRDYFLLFAAGVFLYDFCSLAAERKWTADSVRFGRPLLLVLFGLGVYLGGYPDVVPIQRAPLYAFWSHNNYTLFWHMMGAVLVVSTLAFSPGLQRVFSSRVPRYLGRVSFVLYLVHIPVICSFASWMVLLCQPIGHYYPLVLIVGSTTIALVLVLSEIIYRYVDVRTLDWSRSVGTWVDRRFPRSETRDGPGRSEALQRPPPAANLSATPIS